MNRFKVYANNNSGRLYGCREVWLNDWWCYRLESTLDVGVTIDSKLTHLFIPEINAAFQTTCETTGQDNRLFGTSEIVTFSGDRSVLAVYWVILIDRLVSNRIDQSIDFTGWTVAKLLEWSNGSHDNWYMPSDKKASIRCWNILKTYRTKRYPNGRKWTNFAMLYMGEGAIRIGNSRSLREMKEEAAKKGVAWN